MPTTSEPARVLVTGGTGFIGAHTIAPLAKAGYELHFAHRSMFDVPGMFDHWVDLMDPFAVDQLLETVRPTHLLHLAWTTDHGAFWTSPANLDWLAATVRLFRSFVDHGGRRAVFAGTCAEYEWTVPHHVESDGHTRPATLYGVCKNAAREAVEKFAERAGVSVAWGRVFLLYGPTEDDRRLIPSIYRPLLRGETATVRSGGHVRDLMHVSDVARALVSVLESGLTGPVNIASGSPVDLGSIARLLGRLTGRPQLLKIENGESSVTNPTIMTADVRRLASIGFVPRVSLEDGFADLIRRAGGGE